MALVDVEWLRAHLKDPALAIVDCRWKLVEPGGGRRLYESEHVPGAAFLDVDADLASPPGEAGRHPLPDAAAFERAARRAGIGSGTRVVAYDEAGEGGAARLWWLLRHFGHEDVAVLDGGMSAWRRAGGPVESGPPPEREGRFEARSPGGATIDAAEGQGRLGGYDLTLLAA